MPSAKIHVGSVGVDSGPADVATPFAVEATDGTAFYAGINTAQLPSALGQAVAASSISVVIAQPSVASATSTATAGVLIKSGAGVAISTQYINNSVGTVYAMVFDATSTQADGTAPLWPQIGGGGIGTVVNLNWGPQVYGLPCSTGIWLQFSNTQLTMTALSSTAVTYTIIYE